MISNGASVSASKSSKPSSEKTGLVAYVIKQVRDRIRQDGLKPGDNLPGEAIVAEQLDVSRVVVREAFRSLSALSILDVGGGRRARVASVDPEVLSIVVDHAVQTSQISVQQILDFRRTIESRTVELAAGLRSEKEAEEIVRLARSMRDNFDDAETVMNNDIAFHTTIAHASRNLMSEMVVQSLQGITRVTWLTGWRARASDEERWNSVMLHEQIAQAVADQDRERAVALMSDHFDETMRMLLRSGIN